MPDNTSAKIGAFFKQHKIAAWGITAVLGVSAVVLFRRKAAQKSAQASGSNQAIDPQTGLPVGSPEDEQALQQQQAGGTGFGYDPFLGSGFDPFLGSGGSSSGGGTTGGAAGNTIQTNDQWLKKAESVLPNGHSSQVETALARVLGGLTVTWTQRALFLEAKGIIGEPPEGYPTPIKVEHSGGDQGVKSHSRVKIPHVEGEHYAPAAAKLKTVGLKVHAAPKPEGIVAFSQPGAGTEVSKGSVVTLHMAETR